MFIPLGNKVLIKRPPDLSVTDGGILIPEAYQEKPMEGEIASIGEDVTKVKVGDRVLHAKYAGIEIELKDGKYLIMIEDNIQGIITKDKKNARKRKGRKSLHAVRS